MVVRIAGRHMYLWRAVDHEGEVLEILAQRRRDKWAAIRLMRKLLRKQGFAPKQVTTDKLGSYGAAFRHLGLSCHHEQGLRKTIGTRIRIKWCVGASARCSASNHRLRRNAS
jgi:transposase-like protein